jgi:hypothetical protein
MMAVHRKGPNIFVALGLFLVGTILAYYIFQNNGWRPGVSPSEIWKGLSASMRAIAVCGFVASAYGLGGILNHLLSKKVVS